MSDAFWKRLRDFAERKRHKAWMARTGHDRRCPRCRAWFGGNDSWISCQPEGQGDERIVCSDCGHQSVWYHDRSMLPVSDGFPTPSPEDRAEDRT